MRPTWSEIEPAIRYQLNAAVDDGSLAQQPGGPEGRTAGLVLARLVGHDGQVDDDTLRLPRVEREWLTPIIPRLSYAIEEASPTCEPLRTARYALQAGYATMSLSWEICEFPPDVRPGPDFLVSVLFVRYRWRI